MFRRKTLISTLLSVVMVMSATIGIVGTQTSCDPASLAKQASRVSSAVLKAKPVVQSLIDSGIIKSNGFIERIDQLVSDGNLLAEAFRNGGGDALETMSTSITLVETLINQDAQLIPLGDKKTIVLSFLAAADIALGEISDALSKDAAKSPLMAKARTATASSDERAAAQVVSEFAKKPRMRARDSKTGRFVTLDYARQHPDTTTVERY